MNIWIERFLFAVLSGAFIALVLVNVLKFDVVQRVSLAIAILASSVFAAWTLTRPNTAISGVRDAAPEDKTKTPSNSDIASAEPRASTAHPEKPRGSRSAERNANIHLEQRSEGPDSPNIATFGANSPVNYSPKPNPFATVDYYDYQGARHLQQGNHFTAIAGDELGVFQQFLQLEKQENWSALRDLAEGQISKTGDKWLTPHLFAGKACAHLGLTQEAIKHLRFVEKKAAGSPEYSDASTLLRQLQSLIGTTWSTKPI